jgi:uncharacterized membrane protein YhaH (DUF805 family)
MSWRSAADPRSVDETAGRLQSRGEGDQWRNSGPRGGSGAEIFLFSIVGLNLAFLATQYWLSGGIELMLQFGFRSTISGITTLPPTLIALRAAFDAALLWCVIRRLRDAGLTGWISLAALALPLALGSAGAFVTMLGLISLFVIPGTIGPNKFGPDPRGWRSREHYDEHRERLHSGTSSGPARATCTAPRAS